MSLDLLKMGLIKSGNTDFRVSRLKMTPRLLSVSGPLCVKWRSLPTKTGSL